MSNAFVLHFRVAHASRVLVSASRRNNLSQGTSAARKEELHKKSAMARTPSPARETRALPRHIVHASFLRKRKAHRLKSRFDITMSTNRFGQYSKKFAPRRMIARINAMKYVVGNSAPSA